MSQRYSLTTALALTRAARTAIARADVRYGKHGLIVARLRLALKAVNDAEADLRAAVRVALTESKRRDVA